MAYVTRLNSTGSFYLLDGDYFSYNTRLSFNYKDNYFTNRTWYSVTTAKHQARLPYTDFNHTLRYQRYGYYSEDNCIQFEIDSLKQELEYRQNIRKTKENLTEIDKITEKIDYLSNLIQEC